MLVNLENIPSVSENIDDNIFNIQNVILSNAMGLPHSENGGMSYDEAKTAIDNTIERLIPKVGTVRAEVGMRYIDSLYNETALAYDSIKDIFRKTKDDNIDNSSLINEITAVMDDINKDLEDFFNCFMIIGLWRLIYDQSYTAEDYTSVVFVHGDDL